MMSYSHLINPFRFISLLGRTLLICGLLLSTVYTSPSVEAQSSRPAPITRTEVQIPADTSKPFTVYFEYGSSTFDKAIENIVATASIVNTADQSKNPSFEFVSTDEYKNYDIFDGDPSRPETDPAPRVALPCTTFDGPKYEIPSSFFTPTAMNRYGLQTAKVNPSDTSILAKGSTGCIALQVALTDNAQVGDRASIQFDWDSGPSTTLTSEARPNILIQPLVVTQGAQSSSSRSVSSSVAPSSSSISSSVISSSASSAVVTTRTGGTNAGYYYMIVPVITISLAYFITRKREPKDQ